MSAANDLGRKVPSSTLEGTGAGGADRKAPPPVAIPPITVSLAVAAQALDVSREFLAENYKAWGVPYVELGRRTLIPVEAFKVWLQTRIVVGVEGKPWAA